MFHPRVEGSYYEMGYNYGANLHRHGFRAPEQTEEKLDFGRRSEEEAKKFFPEILEEVQGFADACHAPYEQLAALLLSVGCFEVEQSTCSIFTAFNGSDAVFGRNYDFYYSFKRHIEAYLTCPREGYWSLGHSDIFIGREDGVNEKGLAVGITGIRGKSVKPGVNFAVGTRHLLDRCSSVGEGVKALSGVQHSTTCTYLLADREGDMAVVEASPGRVRTRRPGEGDSFIVCTNHFLHPEMLEMENQKERPWDSETRYKTIYGMLKEQRGKIDVEGAQKILSNHSGYVCSHQKKIQLGTLWSVVATLKQPKVFRAEGHPCRARYREDMRLNEAIRRLRMETK